MNPTLASVRRGGALAGLGLAVLLPSARADDLFVGSPTTLVTQGNPYSGSLTTIGACGGSAQSMTLDGTRLLIGDPLGRIYQRSPSDSFVQYAGFDVPNDAQALAMHAGNLLSAGTDGTVVRVDATTGAVLATLTASVPITAMLVSGDDVYVGSSFGIVQKGNAITGDFQFWGTCGGPVNSLAKDSTHLIIGASNGQIYRINLTTQLIDATFPVNSDAQAMLLHAGDLLVGGANASILRVSRFNGLLEGTITSSVPIGSMAALSEADPGTIYCYGIACPCGNADADSGCAHSRGYGANLAGSGSTSVLADDLELFAFHLPLNRNGRFYMSQNSTQLPLGDGLLCAGSGGYPLFRFPFINSGPSATLRLPPNFVQYCSTHFNVNGHIDPAETWHIQAWFRDPVGPCGAAFNTTNSYSITFTP